MPQGMLSAGRRWCCPCARACTPCWPAPAPASAPRPWRRGTWASNARRRSRRRPCACPPRTPRDAGGAPLLLPSYGRWRRPSACPPATHTRPRRGGWSIETRAVRHVSMLHPAVHHAASSSHVRTPRDAARVSLTWETRQCLRSCSAGLADGGAGRLPTRRVSARADSEGVEGLCLATPRAGSARRGTSGRRGTALGRGATRGGAGGHEGMGEATA